MRPKFLRSKGLLDTVAQPIAGTAQTQPRQYSAISEKRPQFRHERRLLGPAYRFCKRLIKEILRREACG